MLTNMGIKRKVALLRRMAEADDREFNEILQATVRALNRLGQSRAPLCDFPTPQQVDKPGNSR